MIQDVLVVGYGNALRTDDGLGWHAAARLAEDPRLAGATVLQCHQLTPDLAFDVSRASFVVFVDAGHCAAGGLCVQPVEPVPADRGGTSMTHRLDAGVLLSLADELYGRRPAAVSVSVGVVSIDAGDGLTPVVAAMLPQVAEAVASLARLHGTADVAGQLLAPPLPPHAAFAPRGPGILHA